MKPTALLIVRNAFAHDARVLRAAEVLRETGYRPAVLAVMSTSVRERHEMVDGIPVLRLDPGSPFSWARRRLGLTGREREAGVARPGHRDRRPGVLVRLHRYLRTIDFYRRGIGVLLRDRPALVHCNDYNTMWIGIAARVFTSARVIYDSHELWADRNGRPEPRWWLVLSEAIFVRAAHQVITASPGFADEIARRYRVERPTVVLNLPRATARTNVIPPTATEPTVVYVGAITAHRGLEVAIQSLVFLPDVRLELRGPGRPEYVEALLAFAAQLAVVDRVRLAKPVAPSAVIDALTGADVGLALFQPVCLSHRLVAPNKLFEYMSAGVPVLASDLPVIRSVLERWRFGVVVPPHDPVAVAAGVRWLLEKDHGASYRAAAHKAATELTWERERRVLAAAYDTH